MLDLIRAKIKSESEGFIAFISFQTRFELFNQIHRKKFDTCK